MATSEPLIPPVIVVDGIFFQIINTGIARVWRSLFRQWAADGFARHIVVVDRAGTAPKIPGLHYVRTAHFQPELFDADRRMLQQVCDATRANLFISTYYTLPVTTPTAMMVYDMIPEVRGEDLTHVWWQFKHLCIRQAVARMSISRSTTADLCRFFPEIQPESVVTAYPGVDAGFVPCTERAVRDFRGKYGLSRPYYLTIGMRAGYKGGPSVFEAFSRLENRDQYDIVCVGGLHNLEPELAARVAGARVHLLQLPDEEMPLAYAGATALTYPSAYEGFGLPVAEGMAVGCPVITCHNSSIPEVGGEAVLYVDHGDVPALARAMREIQDPAVRARLIAGGLERAKRFSWAAMGATVAQTLLQTATQYSPASGGVKNAALAGGDGGTSQILVQSRTATGGQVISFGKPAAASAAPVAPVVAAPVAQSDALGQMLRQFRDRPADKTVRQALWRQRRVIAEGLMAASADLVEGAFRGEIGRMHRAICGSTLATSPTPVEELPFLKMMEERLAERFEAGAFLAGLMYRPPHYWRDICKGREAPAWVFGAVPCEVTAASQVRDTAEDGAFVDRIFAENQLEGGKTLVVFAGVDTDLKTYAGWGAALAGICRERQLKLVAVGAAGDEAGSGKILREAGVPSVNLCGRLTFQQTVAAIRKCRLAVGVENGWGHIACAVGVPQVLVMGGGEFGRLLPYSPLTSVVTVPLQCFGCGWSCRFSRAHCVQDLWPEVLEVAVREGLEGRSERPRVYLQHFDFAKPLANTLPFMNMDLLPPMLFDITYVAAEGVEAFKVPRPSMSGCPVRVVGIPVRPGVPLGVRGAWSWANGSSGTAK